MTRWELTLNLPMSLPSAANVREHWRERNKRESAQRVAVGMVLRTTGREFLKQWKVMSGNPRLRMVCTMTRIAPRKLDSDNLARAFKAVRDEVAATIGTDDGNEGPGGFWDWRPMQTHGDQASVRIHLEVIQAWAPEFK